MIGLKDTLTLLKSGMSLQEIKEREALDQNPPDEHKPDEAAPAPDPEPQPQGAEVEPQTEGKTEETPDYKKLYETLQKEQEATKQQIKNLQAQINQQDRSGGAPAPYDPQSDLLASLSKFS